MQELRAEGKIRFFGVSVNDHDPGSVLELVRSGHVDTVQVIHNVFDQSPEDELYPLCTELDVGVIARVPFDEGGLTGAVTPDSEFPAGDFRAEYFRGARRRRVSERVDAIAADLGVPREGISEVALRYVLSAPAVSSVIPGMRTIRNVERNTAVSDGPPLPPEVVERLHAHRWERNFYD